MYAPASPPARVTQKMMMAHDSSPPPAPGLAAETVARARVALAEYLEDPDAHGQGLRDALDALELDSHVRTTGGEGLHVLVPIARRHGYEEVRRFARAVASALARTAPELVTLAPQPARRRGGRARVPAGRGRAARC